MHDLNVYYMTVFVGIMIGLFYTAKASGSIIRLLITSIQFLIVSVIDLPFNVIINLAVRYEKRSKKLKAIRDSLKTEPQVKVKPEPQVKVKPEPQVKVKPEPQVKVKPEAKAKALPTLSDIPTCFRNHTFSFTKKGELRHVTEGEVLFAQEIEQLMLV